MNIIGRQPEQELLKKCYEANHSDFVAVYGRRRIGKTYLIKEFFNNRFTFYVSGMADEKMQTQLQNFHFALQEHFEGDFSASKNWLEAFVQLERLIKAQHTREKKVVFIDELPWLDTPKSGFLPAFEHFWNSFASSRPDILLIVCGSATSWMISNLIDNYGGLHNRITEQIALKPFTLHECEEYYRSKGIVFNRYQIAESYMIFGGIPYYMSRMNSMYGLNQNVDMLLFSKTAALAGEFNRLYHSLFRHSENHIKIVRLLSEKNNGLTRQEITHQSGIPDGGGLTKVLNDLEQCGFIESQNDYNKRRNGEYYRLIDFFSLFYLKYIENNKGHDEHFWTTYLLDPAHRAWCGYAFERVCIAHAEQIKFKLGISGVSSNIYSWRSKDAHPSAQIDMIIDRKDGVINLCEIKYSVEKYTISKNDDENFTRRQNAFRLETGTKSALHQTMITTYGLTNNAYRNNIQSEITLDDLF
ncbi:MAG: AAA family ATPase [Clostridiales Family XIII bacterium]|jgi:AAA+ ATPase superfamily predicted ATPase|nr:AAA family ATPase [Clostridiales Family XIII bacterium]